MERDTNYRIADCKVGRDQRDIYSFFGVYVYPPKKALINWRPEKSAKIGDENLTIERNSNISE